MVARDPNRLPVVLNSNPTRINRRPGYPLTRKESVAARALLNYEHGTNLYNVAVEAGFRDLRSRRLITIDTQRGNPLGTIAWTSPAAPARTARRLVENFNLGQMAGLALSRAGDAVAGASGWIITGPEVAFAFAHRYLYTGVHALTIRRRPAGIEIIEHRHHGEDQMLRTPMSAITGRELSSAQPGLEVEERSVHIPLGHLSAVAAVFLSSRCTDTMRIDLDGLWVSGPDDDATVQSDGYPNWMPTIVADALEHLKIPAATVATPALFVAWAETMSLPFPCATTTHHRRVDPHTGHTVAPDPSTRERLAAEHLIAGLTRPLDDTRADPCEGPHEFLMTPLDQEGFTRFRDEDLLRRLYCTVQYLDAGLDLCEAADFIRFGLPAPQAVRLVDQRRTDPDAVTSVLFACVRGLNKRGTIEPVLAAHLHQMRAL